MYFCPDLNFHLDIIDPRSFSKLIFSVLGLCGCQRSSDISRQFNWLLQGSIPLNAVPRHFHWGCHHHYHFQIFNLGQPIAQCTFVAELSDWKLKIFLKNQHWQGEIPVTCGLGDGDLYPLVLDLPLPSHPRTFMILLLRFFSYESCVHILLFCSVLR